MTTPLLAILSPQGVSDRILDICILMTIMSFGASAVPATLEELTAVSQPDPGLAAAEDPEGTLLGLFTTLQI